MTREVFIGRDNQCYMHKIPFYFGENDAFDPINVGYITTKCRTLGMIFDIQSIPANSTVYAFDISPTPDCHFVTLLDAAGALSADVAGDNLKVAAGTLANSAGGNSTDAAGGNSTDAAGTLFAYDSGAPSTVAAEGGTDDSIAVCNSNVKCLLTSLAASAEDFRNLFLSAEEAVSDLHKARQDIVQVCRSRFVEPILLYFQIGIRVYPFYFFAPKPVSIIILCHMDNITVFSFSSVMSEDDRQDYNNFVTPPNRCYPASSASAYITCLMRDQWHRRIIPVFIKKGKTYVRCGRQSFDLHFPDQELKDITFFKENGDWLELFQTYDLKNGTGLDYMFSISDQSHLVEHAIKRTTVVKGTDWHKETLQLLPQAKGCVRICENSCKMYLKRLSQQPENFDIPLANNSGANKVCTTSNFRLHCLFTDENPGRNKRVFVRPMYYYLMTFNRRPSL